MITIEEPELTRSKTAHRNTTLCPVARAGDVIGDRWSMLIVRELFIGNARFDDLQAQTEATPQMLATRLKKLESDGIVERRAYSERPPRFEYQLTQKGTALYPVILALRRWGENWCKTKDEGLAVNYIHQLCGKDPGLGPACAHCGKTLERKDLKARRSDAYERERSERRRLAKGE
jgi:DNA-binding HxlR family transcriptional regulator